MRALRLAEPVGTGSGQASRRDDDDRPLSVEHGELAAVGDACLMDMAGEDEVCPRSREPLEHGAPPRQRPLARSPRRISELVVKTHDAESVGRGVSQHALTLCERRIVEASRLMTPRPNGVEPDNEQFLGAVHGRGRNPLALECLPGPREPRGGEERDVVVSRHGEHRRTETPKQRGGTGMLLRLPAVGDVARCDDELGAETLDELTQRAFYVGRVLGSEMEVGDVDQAGWHSRGRLYTDFVADEPTELFDDLYLGLRAGGAMRKQRRGEPLTMEEEAMITRWHRLSSWRKTIAVGAFALGTFGLGFTLGGLVFGRGRKAKA